MARRLITLSLALVLVHGVVSTICPAQPADLIARNGRILTVDSAFRRVSAVAMRDGIFVAIGFGAEMTKWAGDRTRTVDASGRMVIPGLIESGCEDFPTEKSPEHILIARPSSVT